MHAAEELSGSKVTMTNPVAPLFPGKGLLDFFSSSGNSVDAAWSNSEATPLAKIDIQAQGIAAALGLIAVKAPDDSPKEFAAGSVFPAAASAGSTASANFLVHALVPVESRYKAFGDVVRAEVAFVSTRLENYATRSLFGNAAYVLLSQFLLLLVPVRQVTAREALSSGDTLAHLYAYLFGCCIVAWLGLIVFSIVQFLRALFHIKPEFRNRGWLHFSNSAYGAQGQYLKRSAVRMFWWSFAPLILLVSAIFVIGRFFPIA